MCYDAPRNESQIGRSQYRLTYDCDGDTCKYKPNPTLEYCPNGCAVGDTAGSIIKSECVDCEDFWDFVSEAQCIRALTAHDPNALYGPRPQRLDKPSNIPSNGKMRVRVRLMASMWKATCRPSWMTAHYKLAGMAFTLQGVVRLCGRSESWKQKRATV